jgi:hypothetical protein
MLLVGKPERKGQLARPRRGWVDNIKMDLVEIIWGQLDWIDLAQDRDKCGVFRNAVMNFRISYNAGTLPRSVRRLLIRANVVPSSPILVTVMNEALSSFETSVLTRVKTSQKTLSFIVTAVKTSNLT